MKLAQQAVNEDITITTKNKKYKGVDLYSWCHNHKKHFTNDELEIIMRLMPKREKKVNIINVKSGESSTYISLNEAGRALHNIFNITKNENTGATVIHNRLSGKVKNPIYKNQFRFEYADEEHLKEKSPPVKNIPLKSAIK